MECLHLFYGYESVASVRHALTIHCQLHFLLCHGHGTGIVWFTISILVSFGVCDDKVILSAVKWINKFSPFFLLCLFHRFPFNYRNPIGYLFAFALQYIALMNLFFYVCCMACIGIGFFMFIISIAKDIKNNLKSINEQLTKSMAEDKISEISKQFSKTIQFHADAKQLS